jgi:nicotinate (nicotinamide) nucleotide adenylyltransferase
MTMLKIGFFGGSFSPITIGHIEVAQYALNVLDKVIFIPCNNHPWGKDLVDFKHRFKMCQLAMSKNMAVKDYEKRYKLPGDTFSLITKIRQMSLYKKTDLFFIMGTDEANQISKWKTYRKLLKIIKFVIVPRPGVLIQEKLFDIPMYAWSYINLESHSLLPVSLEIPNISSTKVREELSNYYSTKKISPCLRHNLDPKVFNYIKKNRLYMEKL